jgi:putative transposase
MEGIHLLYLEINKIFSLSCQPICNSAVYTAFIIDVFSRAIVGWKVSTRMNTDMVLDALEQALHDRGMPKNVIHHSDRGVQYLSIRHTNRLEAANLRASVGTTGDSYDNALAETVENGLYKTEVIEYLKAGWQGLADVQLATLNWVDWFNKSVYTVHWVMYRLLSLKQYTMIRLTR